MSICVSIKTEIEIKLWVWFGLKSVHLKKKFIKNNGNNRNSSYFLQIESQ